MTKHLTMLLCLYIINYIINVHNYLHLTIVYFVNIFKNNKTNQDLFLLGFFFILSFFSETFFKNYNLYFLNFKNLKKNRCFILDLQTDKMNKKIMLGSIISIL
jgi:hypothetical protein